MSTTALELARRPVSRRSLLQLAGLGGLTLAVGPQVMRSASAQGDLVEELVIDLASEPDSFDPALTYKIDGWSVVHSVYDSLYQYGPEGALEPLLAQSAPALIDPLTYEIKLRPGVTFHNGEPVDAKSVAFSVAHIVDEKTGSQIAGQFKVISEVKEIDPLTVHLVLAQPAPWLPAQIAAWLTPLPPQYAGSNDFVAKPVGTGPYKFVEWKPGERISLEINPDYFAGSPKGRPVAQRVTYRFVPDASTRVADLLASTAHLVRSVPVDQMESVTGSGAGVQPVPVSGSAWVRIATDVAPFSDVRVRQALNYAVDVDAIRDALYGGYGQRLPNFFAPGGLGFDPALAPYSYDPERARALLSEAGYPDGFETTLDHTIGERPDLPEAIAGQLAEVGIKVTTQPQEDAAFNAAWKDPNAAPLRLATWRPLFDPYTLLSLVVSNKGFLSRYDSPTVQPLIDAFASETDLAKRAEVGHQLGKALYDDPAAIYLFNLTSLYGVADDVTAWTPRADDYIIATARG
ncbi:MAG: peptide/nickel transport system substrate-binding protein [Thermomicrobiales bacterium]|nr:peptide/nickel transport system substrate-binding protein [Thermomicrobiales bacterium]